MIISIIKAIYKIYKKIVRKLLISSHIEQSIKVIIEQSVKVIIEDVVSKQIYKHSRDINYQLQANALLQTSFYVQKYLLKAEVLENKLEMYDFVSNKILENRIEDQNLFCEFGVFKGFSINYLARKLEQNIHGFDSFQGLPEFWRPGFNKDFFSLDPDNTLELDSRVILHKGLFDQTIPAFKQQYPGQIKFIHIDCDLYSSTKVIFDLLADRIGLGCIILFDEYFNYPGWHDHEFKAFQEFIKKNRLNYEYIAYCRTDEQVAVRIRQL